MSHPTPDEPGTGRVARPSKAPMTRFGGAGQDVTPSEPSHPEAGTQATAPDFTVWIVIDEDPSFAALLDASSLGEPGAVALGSRTTGAQLAEILRRARLAPGEA